MNLTVKEVSEILNISERAVRKNCLSGKYDCVYVNGRGGNSGKNILEPVHIKIASKIIAKVRFPKYRTSSLS